MANHNESINEVLQNAPKNKKLTHNDIQKDIVNAIAYETTNAIIEDLNSGFFSILVDKPHDILIKRWVSIVLSYIDKKGIATLQFLGIVHVVDTAFRSLKATIESLFYRYEMSLSKLRGQGYDGPSNMQSEFNGIKALILRENKLVFYVHQLQLTLVVIDKKHINIADFFSSLIGNLVKFVGGSYKRWNALFRCTTC